MALASPDSDSYTDFLPRYRKGGSSEQFIISKIEYKGLKTILHLRFLSSSDRELVRFYGKQTEDAWTVSTPQRGGSLGEVKSRRADIYNIRLNNRLELEKLEDASEFYAEPGKGELLSCEIHFESMPAYIRTVNLLGGEKHKNGQPRFACFDLQLKSKNSPLLGTEEQMQTVIERFYNQAKDVRYPTLIELTSLEQEKRFTENRKEVKAKFAETPIQAALEAIDYMPKMLETAQDLACQERLILKNVQFSDNKADFSRKSQANKSFVMIQNFMKDYPESKLILHGHTDIHGDNYRNLVLSKARVLNIKRALVNKGIDPARIITLYYGGSKPLPLYRNGGDMNRRVELEIICKEALEASDEAVIIHQ